MLLSGLVTVCVSTSDCALLKVSFLGVECIQNKALVIPSRCQSYHRRSINSTAVANTRKITTTTCITAIITIVTAIRITYTATTITVFGATTLQLLLIILQLLLLLLL